MIEDEGMLREEPSINVRCSAQEGNNSF